MCLDARWVAIATIAKRVNDGEKLEQVASDFGITPQRVGQITKAENKQAEVKQKRVAPKKKVIREMREACDKLLEEISESETTNLDHLEDVDAPN